MATELDNTNTSDVSIIDSLPLPSTLDHGILPSLSAPFEVDSAILNPLPPPLPIDNHSLQYGSSSPSEPQLDPPDSNEDGVLPQFDEVNDQYDFLRRTLSHSQRRYSARYKRPRPKPQKENEEQTSLDMPGQRREMSPYRVDQLTNKNSHPLNIKHHTVRGMHAHGDYQQQKQVHRRSTDRRSSPATIRRSTHVDNLGRTYVLDHDTHTVQYDMPSEDLETTPNFSGRREMLNRRYESLQRSFRSAHRQSQRRVKTLNNLSPVESAGAISYLPGESHGGNNVDNQVPPSVPSAASRTKKERKSEKKSKWFSLGRKSHRTVSQSSSVDPNDNVIPVVSPDILSPITPPPSFNELGISLSSPLSINDGRGESDPFGHDMLLDSLEYERATRNQTGRNENGTERNENGNQTERNENGNQIERNRNQTERNDSNVAAILDAINTTTNTTSTQSLPQLANSDDIGVVPLSPTHKATDLDRVKAIKAQRKISTARKNRQSNQEVGGDTDEETDVQSPRVSVVSLDARSPRISVVSGGVESHDSNQRTGSPKASGDTEISNDGEGDVTVSTEEKDEVRETEEFKRQRINGSKRSMTKGLSESPALKFITRPDLYTFLSSSGEAGEVFFSSRALVELVQRIRGQTSLFEKYQHSRQLVKALNRFADENEELPEGWERKLNRQGRIFFIDHDNHITSFIDPRLPLNNEDTNKKSAPLQVPPSVRRMHSVSDEPTVRPHHSTVVQSMSLPNEIPIATVENIQTEEQASYEAQIVAFLRQSDVIDKINQRYRRGVKPNLAEAIEDIKQNGLPGLERIQLTGGTAAYELGLILSLFDEEVNSMTLQANTAPQITVNPPPTSPDHTPDDASNNDISTLQRQKQAFSAKLQTFKLQLARLGFAQSSRLKFNLRRDHLLEDSYEHIMKSEIRHLQRKRLNIAFKGEEGLDYGGPSREFFFLVSREIFNPYFGLFEYSANDTYTVQISSTSCFIRNNLDWFRFAGRIIGLVIAQGFLLDVFFTRPFYKMLLKRSPTLKDLESLEPAFYNSLVWIRENDPAPLDLTFTVEEEAFGQLTTHELKEGGTDIPVLEENKKEYIDLMLKWRLDRGSQEQSNAIMKGFNEIMPVSLIQQFDAQELEFITAGTLEIDIDDWRTHTDYRNGYNANHPVILWFWKAVEMFDNEQRLRLLQFITGTSSVPYEGFKALRGSSGPKRFTIDFFNDARSLPRTHTCFNRLDLPPYPSFEILYEKIRVAVEEGGTFGAE